MFWRRRKSKFDEPQSEPLFMAVKSNAEPMHAAHRLAAETVDVLLAHVARSPASTAAIKMQFRDPDLSEELGEDRYVFIWLLLVDHDRPLDRFEVEFFEVPKELHQWHQPGQRLLIERHDIFDWFVNEDGLMHGGFTMRVARANLPEVERAAYDRYTGVTHWVDMAAG